MDVKAYFNTGIIRQKIRQFLGGDDSREPSCVFLATSRDAKIPEFITRPPDRLDYFLHEHGDFSRSIWDRTGFIFDLDMEYVNFDYPAEPYLDRRRTFTLQEPLVSAIYSQLARFGIIPLQLMTGRGHHFIWQIDKESHAFRQLTEIGRIGNELLNHYRDISPFYGQTIDLDTAQAYAGAGLLMEYLTQTVSRTAQADTDIPIKITEMAVPPQQRGREIIALDISEYGDPLDTRVIRAPYSIYLKPNWNPNVADEHIRARIPLMVVLPLNGKNILDGIKTSQDLEQSVAWARQTDTVIPVFNGSVERLIAAYKQSQLRQLHHYFYSQSPESRENWPHTYDHLDLQTMPSPVRFILETPNPCLMQPSAIRLVTAFLLSRGWHPRHIGGLIRSKYERDHGWLNEWFVYDAQTRADFYTRIFAGQIYTGLDDLRDLTSDNIERAISCIRSALRVTS